MLQRGRVGCVLSAEVNYTCPGLMPHLWWRGGDKGKQGKSWHVVCGVKRSNDTHLARACCHASPCQGSPPRIRRRPPPQGRRPQAVARRSAASASLADPRRERASPAPRAAAWACGPGPCPRPPARASRGPRGRRPLAAAGSPGTAQAPGTRRWPCSGPPRARRARTGPPSRPLWACRQAPSSSPGAPRRATASAPPPAPRARIAARGA
mmetsp:Transcript_67581/g.208940  ORF Transcript_67581/g.208940 Transcript_67581/m.208940 type:complete len:209 (+) Transcript_67581:60-686(+)